MSGLSIVVNVTSGAGSYIRGVTRLGDKIHMLFMRED